MRYRLWKELHLHSSAKVDHLGVCDGAFRHHHPEVAVPVRCRRIVVDIFRVAAGLILPNPPGESPSREVAGQCLRGWREKHGPVGVVSVRMREDQVHGTAGPNAVECGLELGCVMKDVGVEHEDRILAAKDGRV